MRCATFGALTRALNRALTKQEDPFDRAGKYSVHPRPLLPPNTLAHPTYLPVALRQHHTAEQLVLQHLAGMRLPGMLGVRAEEV